MLLDYYRNKTAIKEGKLTVEEIYANNKYVYDDIPISQPVISKVERIISSLPVEPEIHVTGRDTINIEYDRPDKSYLEFEVFKDKIVMLKVPHRDYSKAIEKEVNEEDIYNIVKSFYQEST